MFARPLLFISGLLATAILWSCTDDSQNTALLYGRWELVQGFRNQKVTETLTGTYFRFGSDGKMQTNLPIGPEDPVDFTVDGSEIVQKSTPPVRYQIQELTDSLLVLNLELRGMQFEMHLRRSLPSATPEPALPEETPDTSDAVRPDSLER